MNYIKDVLQHANSYGSRSSILSIFTWFLGTSMASLTLGAIFHFYVWMLYFIASLIFVTFLVMIGTYIYCLRIGNFDALRSESFNIQKLAIERQASSDSLSGIQASSIDRPAETLVIELVDEDEK